MFRLLTKILLTLVPPEMYANNTYLDIVNAGHETSSMNENLVKPLLVQYEAMFEGMNLYFNAAKHQPFIRTLDKVVELDEISALNQTWSEKRALLVKTKRRPSSSSRMKLELVNAHDFTNEVYEENKNAGSKGVVDAGSKRVVLDDDPKLEHSIFQSLKIEEERESHFPGDNRADSDEGMWVKLEICFFVQDILYLCRSNINCTHRGQRPFPPLWKRPFQRDRQARLVQPLPFRHFFPPSV